MATAKDAHTLSSHFKKKWREKYGTTPVVNSHAARWAFDSMLSDMGPVEAKTLIDYYFECSTSNRHDLTWFLYNYEKLQTSKTDRDNDVAALVRIREESKRRTEEWRKKRNGSKE